MNGLDGAIGDCKYFLDTNVLVYLLSEDVQKAEVAEKLLQGQCVVSVQVLNEFASVAMRKFNVQLNDVRILLNGIRRFCRVEPATIDTHDLGLAYCARYGYSVYDCMILAAASLARCALLMSEDLQAGQSIAGGVEIRNPFS